MWSIVSCQWKWVWVRSRYLPNVLFNFKVLKSSSFQIHMIGIHFKDSMLGCWPGYWLIRAVGTLMLFVPPFDLGFIASTGFIRPIRHFLLDHAPFDRQLLAQAHPWLLNKLMLNPRNAPNWTPLDLAQAHAIILGGVQELTGQQFDMQAILLQDLQAWLIHVILAFTCFAISNINIFVE